MSPATPRRLALPLLALGALLLPLAGRGHADAAAWEGEWVTDLGRMVLEVEAGRVRGTYAQAGSLEGRVDGDALVVSWRNGDGAGDGRFEMQEGGRWFKGSWSGGGGGGTWRGWRKDPDAEDGRPGRFAGTWLSSLGTMVLEQKGTKVTGTYGSQGWATLEGEVKGRRLRLTWKRIQWSGPAWLELTPEGDRFFGLTDESPPTVWLGLRLDGFDAAPKPKAGEVVEGRTSHPMLYLLRMPDGWRKGRPVDAIVLLHGSNWTTRGMVHVVASRWPELAKRYAIIGLQGEQWASWSDADDLRFNYTYVNWMGRSTYQGYPYTDRESPWLVAEALKELKAAWKLDRIFLGGHSQGGFLAYILHMHHPELLAGTFPMSGGLVIQAEPDVFEDADLLRAQRDTPLAIVHGTQDDVVPFPTGRYVHQRFLASDFPMLRLFAPASGHPFDFLPVGDVIAWLDALSTTDAKTLVAFAEARADEGAWRDVAAALHRGEAIGATARLASVQKRLDEAASADAPRLLAAVRANADGSWVDDYLAWQDVFEHAPAAAETVAAYRALQVEHDPQADRLVGEARTAFQRGDRAAGRAAWQEIVDRWYASRRYRIVKGWLEEG